MYQVLLVEDDPIFRWVLCNSLQELGYGVVEAGDLAEARAALHSAHCDALLLDRFLPDGDGLDLLPELRAHGSGTPVIVLSSEDSPASIQQALAAGATSYLIKPASQSDLSTALAQALANAPHRQDS